MRDYVVGNVSFVIIEDEEDLVVMFIVVEDFNCFEEVM